MKHHQYASLFPMLADAELQALADDIAANGLQTPIVTLDGEILDGRNRHRACEIAGVDPTFEGYLGGDPLGFVISHNLHRRHLSESQRGMVAAKLANLKEGNPTGANQHRGTQSIDGVPPSKGVAQREAAEMLNVGEATVQRSKKIQRLGSPELVAAVESGEIAVGAAYKVAELPKDEQAELVAKGPEAVKAKAKEIRGEVAAPPAATTKRVVVPRIGIGMDRAERAIAWLEEISHDDPQRAEALTHVIGWCQEQLHTTP